MEFWPYKRKKNDPLAIGGIIPLRNTLEKLQIIDKKAGGWSDVYICRELNSSTKYAIKTPRKELLNHDITAKKFRLEAHLWIELKQHNNLVSLINYETIFGIPALILEYINGYNLSEHISKNLLTKDRASHIAIQIAEGMHYLNDECGYLHRDLKPSNVFIDEFLTAKISDFGTSVVLGLEGTPIYMSPEQLQTFSIDNRSDIYSFGLLYYEMLTGIPFYDVNSIKPLDSDDTTWVEKLREQHLNTDSDKFNKLPSKEKYLIKQCLQLERKNRPDSFEYILKNLIK